MTSPCRLTPTHLTVRPSHALLYAAGVRWSLCCSKALVNELVRKRGKWKVWQGSVGLFCSYRSVLSFKQYINFRSLLIPSWTRTHPFIPPLDIILGGQKARALFRSWNSCLVHVWVHIIMKWMFSDLYFAFMQLLCWPGLKQSKINTDLYGEVNILKIIPIKESLDLQNEDKMLLLRVRLYLWLLRNTDTGDSFQKG